MSRYLDTNTIIGLLTNDPLTFRITALLRQSGDPMMISDLAAVEFAAVIGRKVRTRVIPHQYALDAVAALDQLSLRVSRIILEAADVSRAEGFLRRLDLPLQAPDAIHIAIAQRLGATLVTFDQRMAAAARTLSVAVVGA